MRVRRLLTIAFTILAGCAVAQVPSNGLHLEYRVSTLEKSRTNLVGKLVLDRAQTRVMISFLGEHSRFTCLLMESVSLVGIDRIPVSTGRVKTGIATGRVPYVPALAEILTGFPLVRNNPDGSWNCLNLEAVCDGDALFFEPVRAGNERPGDSYPPSFEVVHNGKTAVRWTFEGEKALGTIKVPMKITRNRFKDSGLNIPHDDAVIWDLIEARTGSRRLEPDSEIIGADAVVYDDRLRGLERTIRYDPAKGSLERQLGQLSKPMTPEPSKNLLWLAGGFGAAVALVALARDRSRRRVGSLGGEK